MTDEQLAKIGAVLHRGGWQVQSFTAGTASEFIKELEAHGFTIMPHPLQSGDIILSLYLRA